MGKIKKKGVSGNAKNFITRTQAVKKLQVTLPDFRRLCIFKGIYPREPRNKKKANKGSTAPTTFYYTKDILYLLHEPVLAKFREHKTFAKKLNKALGRGDYSDAKRLEDLHNPKINLSHIVKERYPSFTDALRDLDDTLSMLFLFANLPSNKDIPVKTIELCERLCNEFQHYVIRTGSLKKSFLSIKGIYYQAELNGQDVRWIVPYKFAQNVPIDVDFRIMLTFVDFYTTLLGFVLFRLYTMEGLVYPPKFDTKLDEAGAGLRAYSLESKGVGLITNGSTPAPSTKDMSNALATLDVNAIASHQQDDLETPTHLEPVDENNEQIDTFTPIKPSSSEIDILAQPSLTSTSGTPTIFQNLTFYLSRETPRQPLEFLLRSFGCKRIGWDAVLGEGSATTSDTDPSITHHIVDRPPVFPALEDDDAVVAKTAGRVPGRIYVQPQYVWDCINAGRLLRPEAYAQGAELPPHLSPWVKVKDGEYDPTAPLPEGDEEEDEEMEDAEVETLAIENGDIEEDEEEEEDAEEWNGMEADDSDEEEAGSEDEEIPTTKPTPASDASDISDAESLDEAELTRLQHQAELEAEAAGIPYTSIEKKKVKKLTPAQKAKAVEKEEQERSKIMMTKKKRKLYEKMMYGNNKREEEADKLVQKRRKIEKENEKKGRK